MHLPVTVKERQAGYLISPYFKDLFVKLYDVTIVNVETIYILCSVNFVINTKFD